MTPADNNVADAMTGRRDLPPPGVTYGLDDCSNLRLMRAKGAGGSRQEGCFQQSAETSLSPNRLNGNP
jgi:hypothetical protein